MALCAKCHKHYNEPGDEQDDHACPSCGYYWLGEPDEVLYEDDLSE